jgi:hypothetical protein
MTLPAGRKKRARFAEVEVASVDGEK